jgi:hypothetical protein
MIETQPRPTIRTLVASFLFTDLVGFSKGTAADQFAAKARLSGVLRRHLAALKESDYWIKDTGDGALIAFVSNPEHALYMALALGQEYGAGSADTTSASLRTGLHLGTVKESIDVEARRNFIGDGINAAKRIMDFALPGQITASRSFFEAIANLDAAYAALFQHVGAPDDKHGRAHELYNLALSDTVLERLQADLATEAGTAAEASATSERAARAAPAAIDRGGGSSKRPALIVAAVVLVIAAITVTMRMREPTPSPVPAVTPAQIRPNPSQTPEKKEPDVAAPPITETKSVPPPASALPSSPVSSAAAPAGVNTSERAAESPTASSAVTPPRRASEAKPRVVAPPPAADTNTTGPSGPRCTRIVEKAALGEPLTPDEKRELANSCR